MTGPTLSPAEWDSFVAAHPRAHVLQQSAWGALKSAFGWTSDIATISDGTRITGGALLLFRPLPFRLGTMAYLPMGPLLTKPTDEPAVWRAVHQCARQHGAAFLKWEPGIYAVGEPRPDFAALGFRPSPQTVQPPRTVLIDISGDEETILARMNQGTRRKIRQSLKNGIRYYEAKTTGDVDTFTAMMDTTGERNAFGVHSAAYYKKAYDLFVPHDSALILAEHQRDVPSPDDRTSSGDALAGIMVFAKGKTAWYLYGASSNIKRNLMAAYGVQWKAIQWAKARGCTVYDMWGIPDEDETALEAGFETRSDGLWGVYGFKRGWGGQVVRSLGAWDKVYNPLVYTAYGLALKVRKGGE
jgi:peptidoglycan pentaglycine glycine transferase (the first glycine)